MPLAQAISYLATTIGADVKDLYTKTDKTLELKQQIPSDTWVLVHNLNKYPSVTIVDSSGEEVIGSIKHDSVNQVTATFSAAFSGSAFFN